MVSADNLNLDVLEVIFSFLSGNDLPAVALGKGYASGETISPFAAVIAHPHLAIHVQNIEISTVPTVKSVVHPVFVRECREALRICKNLKSFKCIVQNVLPMFLPALQEKGRLNTLRIYANLTTTQATMLVNITGLESLSLEFASWNTVDLLPSWSSSLSRTLTTLSLYMINVLHEDIFASVLGNLPNLVGLHVVGCPKLDHVAIFKHLTKTPLLENLSITVTETTKPLPLIPLALHHLRNLALDAKYTMQPSPVTVLASVLTYLNSSSPSLSSFAIKMPERKVVVGEPFIDLLIDNHQSTLRRLAFLDCGVSRESIIKICKKCLRLERLDVAIPMKELAAFAMNISHSRTLRTIVDVDNHVDHSMQPTLTHDTVRLMMIQCRSLMRIVTNRRIWTGKVDANNNVIVSLEKRPSRRHGSLWFMPRD
uniref:Uncharacterized protein n=1 Tax=Psilocybe cubensis TaxID=181762 RepID=A0A8H8CHH6_PSICU